MEHDPYTLYVALSNQVTLLCRGWWALLSFCCVPGSLWTSGTIQSKLWSLSDRTLLKGSSTSTMDTPLIMKRRSSSTEGSLWQTISSLPCEWWLFSLFQSCRNHWELNPALVEARGTLNLSLLNPFQTSGSRIKQIKLKCNNFNFQFYHGHVLVSYHAELNFITAQANYLRE